MTIKPTYFYNAIIILLSLLSFEVGHAQRPGNIRSDSTALEFSSPLSNVEPLDTTRLEIMSVDTAMKINTEGTSERHRSTSKSRSALTALTEGELQFFAALDLYKKGRIKPAITILTEACIPEIKKFPEKYIKTDSTLLVVYKIYKLIMTAQKSIDNDEEAEKSFEDLLKFTNCTTKRKQKELEKKLEEITF